MLPGEDEGEETRAVDSDGPSTLFTAESGRVTGAAWWGAGGSSGSLGVEGFDTGVLACSLSNGASSCTSPGEEDFGITGSSLGISSERRKSGLLMMKTTEAHAGCCDKYALIEID